MKKLFFAVVAMLFAACTTVVTEDVAVKLPETITVSFEESSRIQLSEGKTVWTAGDLVSVFYRSDANQQWKFNGQTGATTAELTKVVEPEATNTLSKVVTIYPYNENYTIDAECKVTATLPAEQEYLADSFGVGSSIMVAESESNNAQLRNAMGWLRLHLTGDGEVVKSITVKGNNSEQVAGQITINPSDATITLAESSTATTVTLNCTDGVTLSSEETAFYIALPPQKFEGGITAEINCNDGSKMVKSTSNSVTIKRNTILPMEELSYQENTRIYYTATEKIVPNNTDVFGANIVSNEWDETTGEGIITFDGEVTTIGSDAFGYCSSLTSVTIPDSVTEIGDWAFEYCSSLTSVTIPDSVTVIGECAFDGCSSLTSVTIGNSVTKIGGNAFSECSSLTSVTIPDSVTKIGSSAFKYCSSLTSVTIPDSVTTLGANPFRSCSKLTEFNGKFASADKRCLIVDGVLNSFAIGCGLTEYAIPNSVTEIGERVFCACSSLTSVTIPNSVTEIGDWAFEYCSSLTSVTIPDSVTEIGDWAFEYCSSLKSVYCNAAYPPTLGSSAFGNTALENIYVYAESVDTYKAKWSDYADKIVSNNKSNSDSITFTYTSTDGKAINESNLNLVVKSNSYTNSVGTLVVYGTAIPDKAFYRCTTLKTVTIPDSVTTIGSSAFSSCSSLTSVTIPNSVTKIGDGAFSSCSNLVEFNGKFASADKRCLIVDGYLNSFAIGCGLTEYTIPDSVTEIGDWAFYNCSSLTSVTIPDSVTDIGYSAFLYCSSLKSVYCKPATPPQGSDSMFFYIATDRKIYVPASDDNSIINAYKAADYWKDYADYIEEYEFTE